LNAQLFPEFEDTDVLLYVGVIYSFFFFHKVMVKGRFLHTNTL